MIIFDGLCRAKNVKKYKCKDAHYENIYMNLMRNQFDA